MHGFAINCNNDLAPYAQIIACGITDAGVTTIAQETWHDVTPADLVSRITEELRNNEEALVATPEGALL
jgi:lipoyl(octanoyl) transferase